MIKINNNNEMTFVKSCISFDKDEILKIIIKMINQTEDINYLYGGIVINYSRNSLNTRHYECSIYPEVLDGLFFVSDRMFDINRKLGYGRPLLLDDALNIDRTELRFYSLIEVADNEYELENKVFFNEFPYINDFLRYVIEYRIKNGLVTIDYSQMEQLLNNFCEENKVKKLVKSY